MTTLGTIIATRTAPVSGEIDFEGFAAAEPAVDTAVPLG